LVSLSPSVKLDKEATLFLFQPGQIKKRKFLSKNKDLENKIVELDKKGLFSGDCGECFPLSFQKTLVLLVGVGPNKTLTSTCLRIKVKNALQCCYLKKVKNVEIVPHDQEIDTIKSVIEGYAIGTYIWRKYIQRQKGDKTIYDKTVTVVSPKNQELNDTIAICKGVNLCRDLINDNADVVTSTFMEKTIKGIVKGQKNVSLEILNKKEMKAKGMGLHLAVNQGSVNEPKLIIVKYSGGTKTDPYTAFIGKGMTFDTGGLNLKPSGGIEAMRIDMSGSAAVVGTLQNVIGLKLKKNILFVVAMAENVTGSLAYKPGDVISGYAGKSVEVANTDAEGRLVLADAISYVKKNYKPNKIIDIATLTGACVVALGHDYTGLMTNDDDFSKALVHASNATDDRVWRLPIYKELKDSVKSKIADIRNLGFPRGAAGAITAAEFLHQFIGDTKWAHLDIAGTAFVENGIRMYFGHGATGAGVRLVTEYFKKQ